jgi:hypothetical protein
MNEVLIDEAIYKLTELKIKAEIEDRARGKVRYVKKSQAYKDLIELLKNIKREVL